MGKDAIIHVKLDAKCTRCGKGGTTLNWICIACIVKAAKNGASEKPNPTRRE